MKKNGDKGNKTIFFFFHFSESPKDFKNIEVSEENVRLDARPESAIGPSSCSSSPTNSPARHSQHYRTLQSYSSPTRKLNIAVTPNHQRDVDQVHSKRWHTAPKEKHKVHISCISYAHNLMVHLTDCAARGRRKSTLYRGIKLVGIENQTCRYSKFLDMKVQFTLMPLFCCKEFILWER